MQALFLFFLFFSAHRKKVKIRAGELAHRNVFDLFSGADKARSASGRPQSRMRNIRDCGVLTMLNSYIFYAFTKYRKIASARYRITAPSTNPPNTPSMLSRVLITGSLENMWSDEKIK